MLTKANLGSHFIMSYPRTTEQQTDKSPIYERKWPAIGAESSKPSRLPRSNYRVRILRPGLEQGRLEKPPTSKEEDVRTTRALNKVIYPKYYCYYFINVQFGTEKATFYPGVLQLKVPLSATVN